MYPPLYINYSFFDDLSISESPAHPLVDIGEFMEDFKLGIPVSTVVTGVEKELMNKYSWDEENIPVQLREEVLQFIRDNLL